MATIVFMDLEVGIKDAKNNLSKLVLAARKGRRVYLVNRGERVAEIIPASDATARDRGRGMLKGIVTVPKGWGKQKDRERWEEDFLQDLARS